MKLPITIVLAFFVALIALCVLLKPSVAHEYRDVLVPDKPEVEEVEIVPDCKPIKRSHIEICTIQQEEAQKHAR